MLQRSGDRDFGRHAGRPATSDDDVLAAAAVTALRAPSTHNSQPWRWVVSDSELRLYADRRYHLATVDPAARMLLLSCGIALHHAVVAVTATGRQPVVERFSDSVNPDRFTEPDHLATVRIGGTHRVTAADRDLMQAVTRRHTDRRPCGSGPLPPSTVDELRASVSNGCWLYVLRADQVMDLVMAIEAAPQVDHGFSGLPGGAVDVETGGGHAERGLRADVLANEPPAAEGVPGRDLSGLPTSWGRGYLGPERWDGRSLANVANGRAGLPAVPLTRQTAVYAVLYGASDTAAGWFASGEEASNLWLTATRLNLAVMPISDVVQFPPTRIQLRRLLVGTGWPYLLFRFSRPAHLPEPARTTRRSAAEVIQRIRD